MAGLAEIEPDHERSQALKTEARAIVQSIANAISCPDLRHAFLQSSEVSAVLI